MSDAATAAVGGGIKHSQRMSAFSQRLVHGDGELLGGVGAAVRPAHEGLALQEHFLGLRLDAENLRDRESDSEQSLRHERWRLSNQLTLYRLAIQKGVIVTFTCKDTSQLWFTGRSKRFGMIASVALRKLAMLDAADVIDDLRVPPGNRLEALKGDRSGQHSIRINAQWRLCFRWDAGKALDVEITDYH